MREILFRGRRTDGGGWAVGSLIKTENFCCILDEDDAGSMDYPYLDSEMGWIDGKVTPVIPETVGQYTGLTDKNGKRIFEGDIVKAQDDIFGSPFCNGITGKVVYEETAFFIEPKDVMETQWLFNECAVYEIIGNIHYNPELLKEGADND